MNLPEETVEAIHDELIRRLDLRRTDIDRMPDIELRRLAQRHLRDVMESRFPAADAVAKQLEHNLLQEVVGLGVLEDLLADDSISGIMVTSLWSSSRQGSTQAAIAEFSSTRSLAVVIERFCSAGSCAW